MSDDSVLTETCPHVVPFKLNDTLRQHIDNLNDCPFPISPDLSFRKTLPLAKVPIKASSLCSITVANLN